jgi:NADP-dependent 3-hydroxy acid dehydrogenase YdfG
MSAPDVRVFTHDDQLRFAGLSGDWNPIHVDPLAARRTPYGQIVHGIHALAWVLDQHASDPRASPPARLRVAFLKTIRLQDEVRIARRAEGDDIVYTVMSTGKALASIRLTPGGTRRDACCREATEDLLARAPEDKAFAQLKGERGALQACGSGTRLAGEFPHLCAMLGTLRVAALLSLSRLVGMTCPGLHSIFSGLDLVFEASESSAISYQVTRHSIPNAPVRVAFAGGGVDGHLDAFVRPGPARQIAMRELRPLVSPGEFSGQTALIVGGSRGLGESMAKVIAAGGGISIVTYNVGRSDADRVATDILAEGGRCVTVPMDIQDATAIRAGLARLKEQGLVPDRVYYFASPAIVPNRAGGLDKALFDVYFSFYVDAFERLCQAFIAQPLTRVFYPSTVFLDQAAPGFAEYICAKSAGEALGRHLAREHACLAILVERLPRMHTDQTTSLLADKAPEPHHVMLDVARKMTHLESEQPT